MGLKDLSSFWLLLVRSFRVTIGNGIWESRFIKTCQLSLRSHLSAFWGCNPTVFLENEETPEIYEIEQHESSWIRNHYDPPRLSWHCHYRTEIRFSGWRIQNSRKHLNQHLNEFDLLRYKQVPNSRISASCHVPNDDDEEEGSWMCLKSSGSNKWQLWSIGTWLDKLEDWDWLRESQRREKTDIDPQPWEHEILDGNQQFQSGKYQDASHGGNKHLVIYNDYGVSKGRKIF